MMKRTVGLAALAATLVSLIGATSASAIGPTYGATYSGTASGIDSLGLFGTRGASLNNDSYTETFLINTLAGDKRTGSNQQDEYAQAAGFITATLTIGGKSVTVNSSIYGEAFVNDGGNVSSSSTGIHYGAGYDGSDAYHTVYDYTSGVSSIPGGYYGVLASYADNPSASFSGFPTTLDQPFSLGVGNAGTTGAGSFSVYAEGCLTNVEDLTLHEAVAAAPEPGAWLLMLAGVGAMGLMLRGRRRSAAPQLEAPKR